LDTPPPLFLIECLASGSEDAHLFLRGVRLATGFLLPFLVNLEPRFVAVIALTFPAVSVSMLRIILIFLTPSWGTLSSTFFPHGVLFSDDKTSSYQGCSYTFLKGRTRVLPADQYQIMLSLFLFGVFRKCFENVARFTGSRFTCCPDPPPFPVVADFH